MGRYFKIGLIISISLTGSAAVYLFLSRNPINPNLRHHHGEVLDSFNGVKVYYNGSIGRVDGRNRTEDGYNLGLKYQCVEFVKRYYFEYYHHKMKDSYGHAKSFFDSATEDGKTNRNRGLQQFTNPSKTAPAIGDIVVFNGTGGNPYGHVAIISAVSEKEIEIIQQNPGPFAQPRVTMTLVYSDKYWRIDNSRVLGRLRKG